MNYRIPEIMWPTLEPDVVVNVMNSGIDLLKEKIGALSQDPNNPLSRVCVANSCFSLEPVRGCPLGCAYCVAGNDCRNLLLKENIRFSANGKNKITSIIPKKPEVLFKGDILAHAMVNHPGFIKDKSIVSVAAGSSEAFLPGVEQETWSTMKYLIDNGYKNPFWFVIKYGIDNNNIEKWIKRFNKVMNKGSKIVISVTESNAPAWLEPYRENRFRNLEKIKKTGVHISHHLRPLIKGINDSENNIEKSLEKSAKVLESICIGGLRVDPGIKLLWKHVNGLDLGLLPKDKSLRKGELPHKNMSKSFMRKAEKIVQHKKYNIPIFNRSSQMLAYSFGINDFNLYDYRKNDDKYFLTVDKETQKNIKEKYGKDIQIVLTETAESIKLNLDIVVNGENILVNNKLYYQEHRLFIHAIGHNNVFSK